MGVSRTSVVGVGKLFPTGGIFFQNQSTNRSPSLIQIQIPNNWKDGNEKALVEIALQGFLRSKEKKEWDNSDLPYWHELLETYSVQIKNEVRKINTCEGAWSPLSTALQLRLLGNIFSVSKESAESEYDLLPLVFSDSEGDNHFLNPELERIVSEINSNKDLKNFINDHTSAQKGGVSGAWVNSTDILKEIKLFKEDNYFLKPIPNDLGDSRTKELKSIEVLANTIENINPKESINKEISLRKEWLKNIESMYGEDKKSEDICSSAFDLIVSVSNIGLGIETHDLNSCQFEFKNLPFDDCLSSIKKLPNNDNIEPIGLALPQLKNTYSAYEKFTRNFEDVVSKCESEIESRLRTSGIKPEEIEVFNTEIDKDLKSIEEILMDV